MQPIGHAAKLRSGIPLGFGEPIHDQRLRFGSARQIVHRRGHPTHARQIGSLLAQFFETRQPQRHHFARQRQPQQVFPRGQLQHRRQRALLGVDEVALLLRITNELHTRTPTLQRRIGMHAAQDLGLGGHGESALRIRVIAPVEHVLRRRPRIAPKGPLAARRRPDLPARPRADAARNHAGVAASHTPAQSPSCWPAEVAAGPRRSTTATRRRAGVRAKPAQGPVRVAARTSRHRGCRRPRSHRARCAETPRQGAARMPNARSVRASVSRPTAAERLATARPM